MISKKICLLGASAVGKTSLARQFVHGIFGEGYLTTVGVRIDKREIVVDNETVKLIVWDLSGEDAFSQLQTSYLRGAAGWILVADGTRPQTLEKAEELQERAQAAIGRRPFRLALNKADLSQEWRTQEGELRRLEEAGWMVSRTSAKTGEGVEALFRELATAVAADR